MEIIKELKELQPEMQTWRRDIHSHPEIAFEEHRTAKIVAEKLESFGIEVETGVCEDDAKELNKPFFHKYKSSKPYIRLKVGVSIDGKIADEKK